MCHDLCTLRLQRRFRQLNHFSLQVYYSQLWGKPSGAYRCVQYTTVISSRRDWLCLCVCVQSVENLPTVFGSNRKAQVAAKTVFSLAHRHGDILREGWKNIMDSMLQLFRAELLPKSMVEVRLNNCNSCIEESKRICCRRLSCWWVVFMVKMLCLDHAILPPTVKERFCMSLMSHLKVEDFVDPNEKISLQREETPSNRWLIHLDWVTNTNAFVNVLKHTYCRSWYVYLPLQKI